MGTAVKAGIKQLTRRQQILWAQKTANTVGTEDSKYCGHKCLNIKKLALNSLPEDSKYCGDKGLPAIISCHSWHQTAYLKTAFIVGKAFKAGIKQLT